MKNSMMNTKKKQLVIIFLTVFIYLLGFGIIIPIIPMLSRDFGASPLEIGLLMSCYSLMQFLFSPFWGRLSDKWGRRPILLGCLVGEGLSYIVFALAGSLSGLFIARLLAGFFSGSISTASAYISDITPPEERSKGMALIGAAFGLGFVFGPAIGGVLVIWGQKISSSPHFDTSFAAYWVAGLCFANLAFGLKFLTESLVEKSTIQREPRFQLIAKYFAMKAVSPLLFIFLLSSLSMSIMEATLILFMGEKFQWDLKTVSFGFAYIGVIMVVTQGFIVRKLIPKFGEKNVLRIGLFCMVIGLGGIAFAPNVAVMAVIMTFLSVGTGLTNPSTLGSISLLVNPKEQGVAMGVTQSMASLGRIIGPALGGLIYGALSIESPFMLSGALALSAFVIVVKIFAHLPEAGRTKTT